MAVTKVLNENAFAKLVKELNALGEQVRARQREKQAVLDQFEKERKRFKSGRISEDTLASSVKKTNAELIKLDKQIRIIMDKSRKMSGKVLDMIRKQQPKVFRVQKSGASLLGGKKKSTKKKPTKKRPVKKKPTKKKVTKKPVKKKPTRKKAKPKITRKEVRREMKAERKLRR